MMSGDGEVGDNGGVVTASGDAFDVKMFGTLHQWPVSHMESKRHPVPGEFRRRTPG